jgi:hypothetical protein
MHWTICGARVIGPMSSLESRRTSPAECTLNANYERL